MDPLTWTGSLGVVLNPVMLALLAVAAIGIVAQFVLPLVIATNQRGALALQRGPADYAAMAVQYSLFGIIAIIKIYVIAAIVGPYGIAGIVGEVGARFLPVWIALGITFALSITFKRKLGLYGKLFDSPIGMVGFGLVMFWVFTAFFADMIMTHDPLVQEVVMKNKVPGTPFSGDEGAYPHYLLGGDKLARDVFSRMVAGSQIVITIAPLATLFAFMTGITLGLPAGYFGGIFDTVLSFLANLILAFPVILLFFLLVTPEIEAAGLPSFMGMIMFAFPILFLIVLFNSRYFTQPTKRLVLIGGTVVLGGWLYMSALSQDRTFFGDFMGAIDAFDLQDGILTVFVSVVFVNSPTVFRIVRGLALDIQTRDYVAAAQTRGEGPWYKIGRAHV